METIRLFALGAIFFAAILSVTITAVDAATPPPPGASVEAPG